MRNSQNENLKEHSFDTATIALALAVIKNEVYGGKVDIGKVASIGLFHDATETITSDLPTPIKYYNEEILSAFKKIEKEASNSLVAMLPSVLKPKFKAFLTQQSEDVEEWKIIKEADRVAAHIKCIIESEFGNREFRSAEDSTLKALQSMQSPEVDYFIQNFIPAFRYTLDEM